MIGALIRGPGQKDVAGAGSRLQGKGRRVFERPLVEAARFEPRGEAAGNASPARDAIERMPAVIEQDPAARQRRINAPVCRSVRSGGGRGLSSQRPPADGSDSADRALVDQRRNLEANRGLEPIVDRVQDAPGVRGGQRHDLSILHPGDQRLLTQDVQTRVQRSSDKRRMAPGRRADVDEIERFAG